MPAGLFPRRGYGTEAFSILLALGKVCTYGHTKNTLEVSGIALRRASGLHVDPTRQLPPNFEPPAPGPTFPSSSPSLRAMEVRIPPHKHPPEATLESRPDISTQWPYMTDLSLRSQIISPALYCQCSLVYCIRYLQPNRVESIPTP